jgi:hypothetical protein
LFAGVTFTPDPKSPVFLSVIVTENGVSEAICRKADFGEVNLRSKVMAIVKDFLESERCCGYSSSTLPGKPKRY